MGRTLYDLEEPWPCTLMGSPSALSWSSAGGTRYNLWSISHKNLILQSGHIGADEPETLVPTYLSPPRTSLPLDPRYGYLSTLDPPV